MNQPVRYIIYGRAKYSAKTWQREKVNNITVTEGDKVSIRVTQHMMSNINITQ
jgi:translation initiation factor IF-1